MLAVTKLIFSVLIGTFVHTDEVLCDYRVKCTILREGGGCLYVFLLL